jgi:hypothetical protein
MTADSRMVSDVVDARRVMTKSNPRADDTYRAAQRMIKMVDGLNKSTLREYGRIDCVSCHRRGGPQRVLAHPEALDRAAVERLMISSSTHVLEVIPHVC